MTDWFDRPVSLNDLVKIGIYVLINHRLKQYYVGKATLCFGTRFLMELGRKQSGEKTAHGYDLVFSHPDTELVYEKSFVWMEKYIRGFDLDALEKEVFLKYNKINHPDYIFLNKQNVAKWIGKTRNP